MKGLLITLIGHSCANIELRVAEKVGFLVLLISSRFNEGYENSVFTPNELSKGLIP